MRVLCRKAEPIPVKSAGRKSNDQRKPSGSASLPPSFPPKLIPSTMLSGQPVRQNNGKRRYDMNGPPQGWHVHLLDTWVGVARGPMDCR